MLSVTDLVLEQHANLLRQGTVLVDPADEGDTPWLLLMLTHEVKSGDGTVLSADLAELDRSTPGSEVTVPLDGGYKATVRMTATANQARVIVSHDDRNWDVDSVVGVSLQGNDEVNVLPHLVTTSRWT